MATSVLTQAVLLLLGVCRILFLTALGFRECLYNGHKLLRQTLEIDVCVRKDFTSPKKEQRRERPWNGETASIIRRRKKKNPNDKMSKKVRAE